MSTYSTLGMRGPRGPGVDDLHQQPDSPPDGDDADGRLPDAGVDVGHEPQDPDEGVEPEVRDPPPRDPDLTPDSESLQMRGETVVHELQGLPVRLVAEAAEQEE